VSLRDRLKRREREGSFSRIRCEECGQGWLTREEVELRFLYAGWREEMGMGPDPRMVGRPIFSEFPRNTPQWREHGF
jgi:hypothetical protein